MKILIDIGHPAQLNFYKNAILELSKKNIIYITYINRGRLPVIVKKELRGIQNCILIKIGNHRGTILSVIFEANIIRLILLFFKMIKIRPDIELSNGYQAGIYPKFARIPAIHFSDDPERGRFFLRLMKFFSDEIYFPFYSDEKIKPFKALKEWSYLSPRYFTPNNSVLKYLGIKEKQYVFIREVITGTLNYKRQKGRLIESVAGQIPKDTLVLLSLEDKSRAKFYPKNWIILKEPIEDIHSLIYYSKLVVSSGDSIAREGAQLGIPSVYCGVRKMFANQILIDKNLLIHENAKNLPSIIKAYNDLTFTPIELERKQLAIRENLNNEWDDITSFILQKIDKI
jgi:predicted glycosyltransferase